MDTRDIKKETHHAEAVEHGVGSTSRANQDTAARLFQNNEELHEELDAEEERRLVRKTDLMILPQIFVCYAFFYIDKTTLSYAAIFGIQDDLDLHGTQYNWLSSLFYFGFLAWAFPTNMLLQRLPVGKYLGCNIFLWGIFLMLQAACHNFSGLAVMRFLGGAAEACADPAFILITSMWYTRREQPVRIGLWYSANGLGIAGGGLLGYGIGNIRGALPSWKYEFLVIGALCCVWGVVLVVLMPDSPVTAAFLSKDERKHAVERLRENQTGIENKTFKPYQVIEAFKDYKLYFFFAIAMFSNAPNGGISNFGTLIIKGLDFSTLNTTLLQVPYGAIITASILCCVFINDHIGPNKRCLMIVIFMIPNIGGALGLLLVPQGKHVARLMCYYLTGPYNAAFVLFLSLQTGNVAGHTKKIITNAVLFLGYCVGNIAGPFFYKTEQRPEYHLGIASMLFSHFMEVFLVIVLGFLLARENRKRDKLQEGEERDLAATAFADLTDKENKNFRYVY